tara:strand:- start:169 stop:1272 length:1104 start_codon:yes stop_codon:yes gene_type:complete
MEEKANEKIKKLRSAKKHYNKTGDVKMVIRIKVLIAYLRNISISEIAQCFEISKKTIKRWVKKFESGDEPDALLDEIRSGRPPKLNEEELSQLRNMIKDDQERVWVARHVYELIVMMFSTIYSVKYIPELLRGLDLSFHKAVHYLVKKNEEKRSEWVKEKLPKIYEKHIKEGWRIFYQDEVGFQTEGTLAYSWGPKGEDIVVKNKGRHGRENLMGAYEVGSGEFFYKMTFFKVNALRFKRFLCCLKRKHKNDKFIIISDNASFHKAKWFTAWWKGTDWLRMEFLPAYSPDFNPIERLWKWIKKEYTHNKCWSSKIDLRKYLEKKLKEMTNNVQSYVGTMRQELLRLKVASDHYKVPFVWDQHLQQVA